ncbi:MAG: glycosyltransferase family 4 protein [Kofleriaceae bacterium]|nr:glycosyltransferase family 4 protein [Kofleriaceae bacterium]MCL4226100.1 glycosyltransferase family 4 protein [Myxococcales bacterium]
MARILITGFCAVPGPTRAGVQLRHVVRALAPGHTVDLLVVRDGDQAYVERQGNGRLLRVPTHDADLGAQVQAFQRALRRQLEGADYDVVHCRDGWSGVPVLEGKERFGYAMVYDLTRAPMTERGLYEPELVAGLDRDEEACLLGADLILVPSEPARRYATSRGRPERIVLSPPGVDVDRFDWDEASDDGGPPVILYAGPIAPGHGVRVLLRAMVDVVRATAARLLLVGPVAPGFAETLRGGISELGLGARVEVRPALDHDLMPALIATAAVCVAPAAADLTPRPHALYPTKLLEYMACRRAVVAPRRGTVAMLIDHGREGLLFQPGDPADLGRKLRRLLEDASLRDRLAGNGYERVRREFTASAARRAIKRAYALLAEQPEWRARFAEAGTGSHDLVPAAAGAAAALATEGGDDDFEATVYEAAPTAEPGEPLEVALDGALESSLSSLDAALATLDSDLRGDGPYTDERELPATLGTGDDYRTRDDETQERLIGADGSRDGDGSGSARLIELPRARRAPRPSPFDVPEERGRDPWIVVHTARERLPDRTRDDDEGTPLDVVPAPPPSPVDTGGFVAGEIDVPTPTPELVVEDDGGFTAASRLLGPKEP